VRALPFPDALSILVGQFWSTALCRRFGSAFESLLTEVHFDLLRPSLSTFTQPDMQDPIHVIGIGSSSAESVVWLTKNGCAGSYFLGTW
jgi:hypothetical protein